MTHEILVDSTGTLGLDCKLCGVLLRVEPTATIQGLSVTFRQHLVDEHGDARPTTVPPDARMILELQKYEHEERHSDSPQDWCPLCRDTT